MTLLSKIRTPILSVGLRNFHGTAALKSVDPPDWDEKKFLEEEKPWLDFDRRYGFGGYVSDPHPILNETYDEPHGMKLIPVWWVMFLLGIIPASIYGWYQEYDHIIVHPHRTPFARLKHEFLHAEGPKAKFPYGDGRHTFMHHPYYNFLKEGYETDKDGNMLPPGEYAQE